MEIETLTCSSIEKLRKAALYCITTDPPQGETYPSMAEQACRGGADIIQLREKKLFTRELVALGKKLKEICLRYGTLFIVNDRVDVALSCHADGVHLGQEDLSVKDARSIAKLFPRAEG